MLPKKSRHVLLVLLILALSAVGTTALAKTAVFTFITEAVSIIEIPSNYANTENHTSLAKKHSEKSKNKKATISSMPMFMTIIQGADEEVTCADDGSTVARFNLCGDSDDRVISLSGAPHGSVSWEVMGGSCSADINEDCPDTTNSCYSQVSTSQNFTLDASAIPATTGTNMVTKATLLINSVIKSMTVINKLIISNRFMPFKL